MSSRGQASKIPAALDAEILARASQGETSLQITAWLLEAHGIEVDDRTVRRRVRSRATERADATKVSVRDALGSAVLSDLDVLEKIRNEAMSLAEEHRKSDPRTAIAAYKAAADAADKRLHYAGADAEGEERVPETLADLLEAAGAPEAPPPRDDTTKEPTP